MAIKGQRYLLFFLLKLAARDSISTAMVESGDITPGVVEVRTSSQAMRSITTVLEREREVGEFPLQDARSSQNRVSWDWTQGLGGDFIWFSSCHIPPCLGSSQATFYHLFCLSRHIY